jgi:metal-responsive CopG/Arc/MetJ family transcriptional regulator
MSGTKASSDKVRFQIDLSSKLVTELDELMELCDIPTKRDLVNNALTLLRWAVDEVRRGRTIASVNETEQRYRELSMPILTAASSKRPTSSNAAAP